MYSLVKDYLLKKNVLISYVRNPYGYRIGVVVAIGRDKIGWSMVNHDLDYQGRIVEPHQLPVFQKMLEDSNRMGESFNPFRTKAYQMLVQDGGYVRIPKFDKYEGLRRAIEDAENGKVQVIEGTETLLGKIPINPLMVEALNRMLLRSRKVKRFSV
jgi:hypothetical protein